MQSRRLAFALAAVLTGLLSNAAFAGPYADTLGKCLVSSTSPAEKTMLIRWIFATMALHPDVQSLAAVSPEQRQEITKDTAKIFERLLTDSCAQQTRDAIKYEGPSTIESAFGILGQVAMRELFTNDKVAAGLEDFSKAVDAKKVEQALGKQP
ncbi:MAG TPA: hypothetical protein VKH35_04740 [Thermoanaerobaculia bacterium]|nr:hypothetical protein [Thermoanaerobaculia bacterium]